MSSRILILNVDNDNYDSLVEALLKRHYISVVPIDREGRKRLSVCPVCNHKLKKEASFTIDEHIVDAMIKIVEKMRYTKTVLLVNKENPQAGYSTVEHERCVEVDPVVIYRAETLGLLKPFLDGSRKTHYVTTAGLEFLSGEKPASPCTMFVLDGEVVETSGQLVIEDVKFKDAHRGGSVARDAARVVKALPESVMSFVINGQMSLI
jgi:hypothetical protein